MLLPGKMITDVLHTQKIDNKRRNSIKHHEIIKNIFFFRLSTWMTRQNLILAWNDWIKIDHVYKHSVSCSAKEVVLPGKKIEKNTPSYAKMDNYFPLVYWNLPNHCNRPIDNVATITYNTFCVWYDLIINENSIWSRSIVNGATNCDLSTFFSNRNYNQSIHIMQYYRNPFDESKSKKYQQLIRMGECGVRAV